MLLAHYELLLRMKQTIFSIAIALSIVSLLGMNHVAFAQSDQTTNIRAVKARYCNDPNNPQAKRLFLETESWVPEEICIDFINESDAPATIGINFVDGTITDDNSQNKACLAEWQKQNFWQYVSDYPDTVYIAPRGTTRINATLLYDGWYAGTSYGCLTFHAISPDTDSSSHGGISVQARVWSFIDAFVKWDFVVKLVSSLVNPELYRNITRNPNLIIYRTTPKLKDFFRREFWTYKTKRNVTNEWNIGVTSDVRLTITNRRIFKTHKTLKAQELSPWQTRTFEAKIPRYMTWILAWPVRVSAQVQYQWMYLGSYADTAPQEIFKLQDRTNRFFIPWVLITILWCIFYLYKDRKRVCRILRKRRRKLPKITISKRED